MNLDIHAHLSYSFAQPTDILLQCEAAIIPEQEIIEANIDCSACEHFVRVPAQDMIGDRIWIRAEGKLDVDYTAKVSIQRIIGEIAAMEAIPPHQLPGETVQYLMDSVYCPASELQTKVAEDFHYWEGGAKIAAMRDWIKSNIEYTAGASDATTTAADTMASGQGVCRDFAHVLITLARASAIPARFASVFAPDVTPPDFHAVAEVFLANPNGEGGSWHLVDPTGMAKEHEMAKIGVGRDAADVSFLTSYGWAELLDKQINVTRC